MRFFHSYAAERRENRHDFEEGMDELFNTMFNHSVLLYMMDEHATPRDDIYDEAETKIYLQPKVLTAKVEIAREHGEGEEQTTVQSATITFPNRQFICQHIPHKTQEDLEKLKKAIIKFKDYVFLVFEVTPVTQVADTFLFYKFNCITCDKSYTSRYILPKWDGECYAL